ncbi:hypothetical protein FA15DRAFT_754188 [Coprinopsis marcescibilis]|uniref:CHAT domain-containing protein n=1 Tax=Coprinopsis marcescibilis TaxID=230819 RepID=A0A5C3LGH6_COPMA|nr:hypothetical protein FA15DRAFT_754188 [Coprinopsis marcescibilis]
MGSSSPPRLATAQMLLDQARQHFSLFKENGDVSEINKAVDLQRQSVASTPRNYIAGQLFYLGDLLLSRFDRVENISDLEEAIKVLTDAVMLAPPNSHILPRILTYLGISYRRLFEHTGNIDALGQAIEVQRKSVGLIPETHEDYPGLLTNLANSLGVRYRRASRDSDVDEAIDFLRRAVSLTSDENPDQPRHLTNLGSMFECRFEQTGQLSDIEEAIRLGCKAVSLAPKGYKDLPAFLINLGGSLLVHFDRTGDLSRLHLAIREQQRAVHLLPKDHPMRRVALDNLGGALLKLTHHTTDISDIDEAIKTLEEAVLLIPKGHHTSTHGTLNNLGLAYAQRFELNKNLADIDKSIAAHKEAFSLIHNGHSQAIAVYSNLGASLSRRFDHSRDASDINEAIVVLQMAVNMAPTGYPGLHRFLDILGTAYLGRYSSTSDPADAEKAINAQQRALSVIPPNHAQRPKELISLGNSYLSRFMKAGSQDDLNASLFHFKTAALSDIGRPSARLEAAFSWATGLHRFSPASPELLDSYGAAVRLMSLAAGLGHTIDTRHVQLANWFNITLHAAAAACSAKRPDKAVEWLDQGRCLVWNQLKLLRTPLLELQERHPTHAEQIKSIAKQLEIAGCSRSRSDGAERSTSEKVSMASEVFVHTELAKEWDNLLAEVRGFAKFENFLQPSPISSLLENLPDSGPIVVINIHETRCDALALIAGLDEPVLIPLLEFTLEKAQKLREDIFFQLDRYGVRMRGTPVSHRDGQELEDGSDIRDTRKPHQGPDSSRSTGVVCQALSQVWKDLVEPTLNVLEIPSSKGETPSTRIWWCVTGPLAFLPIHAAGIYSEEGGPTVSDYVVSSYTPTVGMLTDRIKSSGAIEGTICGLLLANPDAAGLSTLPGTSTEVESINDLCDKNNVRALSLKGSAATSSAALKNMETYSSIHFACHATQDTKDPLNSGFFFTDGRLDLSTIIKRNLKNADFAFLSACQTSTGDARLTEEAVHLAAGMLAAGYRGVVSTMWSVFDLEAPKVAKDFYEHLLKANGAGNGGQTQLDSRHAAVAMHQAIGKLRERIGDSELSLISWVPYVHFGL